MLVGVSLVGLRLGVVLPSPFQQMCSSQSTLGLSGTRRLQRGPPAGPCARCPRWVSCSVHPGGPRHQRLVSKDAWAGSARTCWRWRENQLKLKHLLATRPLQVKDSHSTSTANVALSQKVHAIKAPPSLLSAFSASFLP